MIPHIPGHELPELIGSDAMNGAAGVHQGLPSGPGE